MLLLSISQLHAQNVGGAIEGFAKNDANQMVSKVTVSVENTQTGFKAFSSTNEKGYFSFKDLPVGKYNVVLFTNQYDSLVVKNNLLNFGDRLRLNDLVLHKGNGTMEDVVVKTSGSFQNSMDRLGSATAISGRAIHKIPLQTRNYTDLAALSPLANGGSIGGAKAGGTGYMLDGVSNRRATFGGVTDAAFSISSEVIGEMEVSNNSYDVTNGRGSGGVIKAITKSGTNTFHGSAWSYYGANQLAAHKNVFGNKLDNQFTKKQVGALFSGAIVKDKLHYLVAYDQYANTIPFRAYDFSVNGSTLEQAEKNLGITKANLDKVVSIMDNQFGFPVDQEYGSKNITQMTRNAFAKIDWNINSKNLLTVKYNYLHFVDPNKLKSNGLLTTQYTGTEIDNGLLLSLRTQISANATNELKFNYSTYRKFLSFLHNRVPEGFVNVTSTFSDGTTAQKQVAFGNQNWVPERDASNVYQLIDYFRLHTEKADFVFGTDNNINNITDHLTHDQQGQFYYASLADMENNNPYRFNRKIGLTSAASKNVSVPLIELGLFAQMHTQLRNNLDLTVGIRWDGNIIGNKTAFNPTLYNDLGIRTDVTPFDAKNFQPRVNLIWDVNNNGRDIVKWGAGLFASELTTQPITFSRIDNGLNFAQIDIRNNVPVPDWKAYQSDFSKVPGYDYYQSLNTSQPATVLALDPHLKIPLTLKTNASYYHYFNDWLRGGVNVYFNNTWDNFYIIDKNMKTTPDFVTNEGRDVYVPASTLSNETSTSFLPVLKNSRISQDFNQVRYFTNANWSSKYFGFMAEVSAKVGVDGSFNLSYARGRAKGNLPYDNGDPRNSNFSIASSYNGYSSYGRNWYSDEDQPNKIVAVFLSPTFYGFSISTTFQAYQNGHFTANINKDVIGTLNDGTNLAYVYDPNSASTPENIKEGMTQLLAKTSPEYRKYLEKYMGKFAPYNGGLKPWQTQWNMSIAKDFTINKIHKIGVRCDIFNVLNLVNHKWGGYNDIVNTTLYNVTGFDQATKSFTYSVNENAGQRLKTASYYTVQLGLHYSF